MNLLNKLTKKNLILNKKRTIVTVIGIILSVALITALASLVVSFKYSLMTYEKKRSGDYHVSFSHVLSGDVENIKNNRYVENVYFTKDIGYSLLEGIKNEDKPYVFVRAYDNESLSKLVKENLIAGRLPENDTEVVIPRHLKTNGRVELNIGDTVNLSIGYRATSDANKLDQSNPYQEGEEKLVDSFNKEYKVVGVIERPSYNSEPYVAPGYTFITYLNDTDSSLYTAYVRYHNKYLKDYYKTIASMLGVDVKIFKDGMTGMNYESEEEYLEKRSIFEKEMKKARFEVDSINSYLISMEYQDFNDSSMKALYTVTAIVFAIIMATSIYCIKNSFDISITEKVRQYGMLASVGATRKQIKRNVLYEAFVLGIIAIPIGILSGILASFILIKVAGFLVGEALGLSLSFKVSIYALLLSLILSSITIYFSAIRSARKASKISPIVAIRNSEEIKINNKKIKSPKIIKKLFGIGGDVSYKNLKRNNKKYRTTVISIVVCVSVFISLYSFMNLAFKAVDMSYKHIDHNIDISFDAGSLKETEKILSEILALDGIKDYSIVDSVGYIIKNPHFTKDYLKYESEEYINDQINRDGGISGILESISDYQFKKFVSKNGLDYENVKDKAIIINNTYLYSYDEKKKTSKKVDVDIFDYAIGDKIEGLYYDYECKEDDSDKCWKDSSLEIGGLVNARPLGNENVYSSQIYIIVSDELLKKYKTTNGYINMYLDVEKADAFQDKLDELLVSVDDYHVTNYDKEAKQSKSLYLLVAIFLYGFITVIALIGITNIFNTITTSVELRAREFATLKSVGMTKREFNRMIRLESVFYGFKSLIIGIPIGVLLSYLIYKALVGGDLDFAYSLPIGAIIISVIAVFVLISIIMKFSINKIAKQNTIETIRNDNI